MTVKFVSAFSKCLLDASTPLLTHPTSSSFSEINLPIGERDKKVSSRSPSSVYEVQVHLKLHENPKINKYVNRGEVHNLRNIKVFC